MEPPRIVFLSSSMVNVAQIFAKEHPDYLVFLIHDRAFPFSYDELENFHSFTFSQQKLFEKKPTQYFDELGMYLNEFSPSLIITNNFSKLMPRRLLEFLWFREPSLPIINIHHGDLEALDTQGNRRFAGLYGGVKQLLEQEQLSSTIHHIEDEEMDTGTIIAHTNPTTLKELKQKKLLAKKEDILTLRMKNQVIGFHERQKVLHPLGRVVQELITHPNNNA